MLAVVCVFMICDADGSDADPTPNKCGEDLYWSMSEGCATFTGSGDMWDYAPGDARGWQDCSSVILPEGLTKIGNSAFEGCTHLASVTIPDSVISIGDYAFRGCASLASVTIPDSVTSIGTYAFKGCNSLTTLYIPCNNPLGITANDSVNNGGISQNVDGDNLFPIHDYSATYTWADDGSACTVDIACSHGDTENHQEHPEVAHTVKIPPTETEMGTTTYSVSGTYDGFAYSDTKDVQDIPATGKPGGSNDNTLLYIAAGGAIAAVALIGGAFFLLRRP